MVHQTKLCGHCVVTVCTVIMASSYFMFIYMLYLFFLHFSDREDMIKKLNKTSVSTSSSGRTSGFVKVVPILTLVVCIINIVKEMIQMFVLRWKYFTYATNYLELALYTSTFVFMLPFVAEIAGQSIQVSSDVKWHAGSISILFTWINLLLFLQRFPFFGLYVLMFVEVLQTVLRLLTVFSIFIIAFALSYFVLLSEQSTFSNVWKSMVKTFVMTIGEFEYDSVFTGNLGQTNSTSGLKLLPYPVISYIIFTGFCLLMPIIIMNLLVSLHSLIFAEFGYVAILYRFHRYKCTMTLSFNCFFEYTGKFKFPFSFAFNF